MEEFRRLEREAREQERGCGDHTDFGVMGLQKCFWTGCDEERKSRRMKTVLLLIGLVLASLHFAEAQQPKEVPHIGYVFNTSHSAAAFCATLCKIFFTRGGHCRI
jgi:hypothetical protein